MVILLFKMEIYIGGTDAWRDRISVGKIFI